MSDTVIKVENLSKKYILSHQNQEKYTALRDVMANGVRNIGKKILSPFNSQASALSSLSTTEDFYALNDVSFEIKQGDRVGIIGRNGAVKDNYSALNATGTKEIYYSKNCKAHSIGYKTFFTSLHDIEGEVMHILAKG